MSIPRKRKIGLKNAGAVAESNTASRGDNVWIQKKKLSKSRNKKVRKKFSRDEERGTAATAAPAKTRTDPSDCLGIRFQPLYPLGLCFYWEVAEEPNKEECVQPLVSFAEVYRGNYINW